jgi:sucrose-6-phosphate hydrolase SacC (GH32 family)
VLEKVSGDTLDIELEIAPGAASEVGLLLRRGSNEETVIGYEARTRNVFVDRTRSGRADFDKRFAGRHEVPVPTAPGGSLALRILVDRSSVEVFADSGMAVITDRIYPSARSRGAALYARGGAAQLLDLKAWRMRSAWQSSGSK